MSLVRSLTLAVLAMSQSVWLPGAHAQLVSTRRRVPGELVHDERPESRRWRPTRPGTSSSCGRATGAPGRTRATSASRPALRRHRGGAGRRVPGELVHDGRPGRVRRWRPTRPGTSSSCGSSYGSAGTDTSCGSIQGQRYDSAGAPQGGEFQVNSYTTSDQSFPAVASDAAGNFVVVWKSDGSAGTDTSACSIQGQRYDSAGAPQGGEFQVNSYTTGDQRYPAVASDAGGNFVVVWQSYGRPGRTRRLQHPGPALRQRGRGSGRRVPGELVHDELPV